MTGGVDCSHGSSCDSTADHLNRRMHEIARDEAEKIVEKRLEEASRDVSRGGGL